MTLAFTATSFLTVVVEMKSFLLEPQCHIHMLVTSFLLVGRRTKFYPYGRRSGTQRFPADRSSVLLSYRPFFILARSLNLGLPNIRINNSHPDYKVPKQ